MKKFLLTSAMFVCVIIGTVFTTSSAQASEVRQILRNEEGWQITVTMRNAPTIYGKEIRIINTFRWPDIRPDAVELTGNTENGWVEILYPTNNACDKHGRSHCRQMQGWIFGEFVGILPENIEYVVFKKSKGFRVIRDRVIGRLSRTILALYHEHHWSASNSRDCCAYTFNKGDTITIIGKRGRWFGVIAINGKSHSLLWVYDELVEPVN